MKLSIAKKVASYDGDEKYIALATIIKASGSSPRDSGASMLVYPDGTISGTIGGGAVEKEVMDRTLELFKGNDEKKYRKMQFDISNKDAAQEGGICGGKVVIFVELIENKGGV
jgi:xanthine dehydrogenase accessory factor